MSEKLCAVCGRSPHAIDDAQCMPAYKWLSEQFEWALGEIRRLRSDESRLNELDKLAAEGVVSICFEFDGGFHVTHDGVGTPQMAARNVDDVREGLDWHINMRKAREGIPNGG